MKRVNEHTDDRDSLPQNFQERPGRWKWLRHAFAVDDPKEFDPTDEQKEVVDKICRWVAKKHMTTPSLVTVEVLRPLNYVGSQALHFFRPAVAALLDTRQYRLFAEFLEHRGSMDYLCRRLEHFENELENASKDADAN